MPLVHRRNELPMTRVYAVRIIDRTGHQSDNAYWKIGAWLRYRPEQIEDNHGPGGGDTYEPRTLANEATFTTRAGADSIVKFMHKRYPGVECMTRSFILVDES